MALGLVLNRVWWRLKVRSPIVKDAVYESAARLGARNNRHSDNNRRGMCWLGLMDVIAPSKPKGNETGDNYFFANPATEHRATQHRVLQAATISII